MSMEITYRPITQSIKDVLYLLDEDEMRKIQAGYLHGICALAYDIPVGLLLYHIREDRIILDNIFVNECDRRQGIGTGMLDMLFKAVDSSGKDLWIYFDGETIRDSFYRFLSSTHAFYIERSEGFEVFITKEDVADISRRYHKEDHAELFFSAPMAMQMEFIDHMEKHYSTIAWELKNNQNNFYKPLCTCSADKNGIEAVCLFGENDGELELRLLYSRPGKGIAAAKALVHALGEIDENDVMPMRISVSNSASKKILDKMCPNYAIIRRFYSAYYIGKKS